MRMTGVLLAALLLGGCTSAPAPQPKPSFDSALAAAAAREFTVVTQPKERFPAWSTKDLDGYSWTDANLRGRFIVVNFWASWCQPCVDEWPELQQSAANHPDVQFIGIDTMDSAADAKRFLKQHPSEYRHIADPEAKVLKGFASIPNSTLPTTIILDADHRIAAWKVGPVKVEQLRRVLRTLYDVAATLKR